MGHLTRVANTIARQADTSSLGEFFSKNIPEDQLSEWGEFVKTTLESINKIHEQCLVSIYSISYGNQNLCCSYEINGIMLLYGIQLCSMFYALSIFLIKKLLL